MSNPFGDEEVSSSAGKVSANPFGDETVEDPRGFLQASAKSGWEGAKGATWTALDALNPFTTSEADLAELYKNDPAGFAAAKTSPTAVLQRFSKGNSARSAEIMQNLTPEGEAIAKKEYGTLDAGNAAYLSPTRIAGDVLQSAPSSIILGGTVALTRGAARTAYNEALAAGVAPELARVAAMRAGGEAMAKAGAVGEGTLGAAQQYNQTLEETAKLTREQRLASPRYRELKAQGWSDDTAWAKVEQETAISAGAGAGAADAAVSAVGGQVLGRVIGGGSGMGKRVASGFAEQAAEEAMQSPLEQISGNLAKRANVNPFQDPLEGAGEAAVAGAVVGGVTGAAVTLPGLRHNNAEHSTTLARAAAAKETEAVTGLAPSQADAVNDLNGTNQAKPHLTPVQAQIVVAANAMGMDPKVALTIASIETGGKFDAGAQNPNSSAHGLFQMIDSTWTAAGGGDRSDPVTQIRNGLTNLVGVQRQLTAALGHEPDSYQMYMGQLFGAGGAARILQAASMNPQGPVLETIKLYDAKNAEAIVRNNGLGNMTNERAVGKIAGWVLQHERALGQDPVANRELRAAPESDNVPDTSLARVDEATKELDRLLAEDELKPLTPAEEAAAAAEETAVPGLPEDPVALVHANALDAASPPVLAVAVAEPALPGDLASAAPRYGFGKNLFTVKFATDVDKAAYIVGKPGTKSPADARYVDWLSQNTGMTEEEARAYGREVSTRLKEKARAAQNSGVNEIQIGASPARADSYVSLEEAETRNRYPNPNDRVAVSGTPIAAARDGAALGQNLRARSVQAGEVVALNIEGKHAPQAYVEAVQQTLQGWVDRFAPKAKVALTFRTENVNAISGYANSRRIGRGNLYQINMRNATNFGLTDDGTRNSTTQRKISYALAHEFGHLLVDARFKEGLPTALQDKFDNLGVEEFFTEEDLASMAAPQAAVLREYNALKRAVLTDPSFTARRFMQEWLSPWKLAHGSGKVQGEVSFAKKYLGEGAAQLLDEPAGKLARKMQLDADTLSPHEYMAEQMARYAYSQRLLEEAPIGTWEFFRGALLALREFFVSLKRNQTIEPGVKFAEWVDGLTETSKDGTNATVPGDAAEAVARKRPTKPRVTLAAARATANVAPMETVAAPALVNVSEVTIGDKRREIFQDPASGWWYDKETLNADGVPSLGMTKQQAVAKLVQQYRLIGAQTRKVEAAKTVKREVAKPSVVPPGPEKHEALAVISPGMKTEEQVLAEHILRTDPMLKDLRETQPEQYRELAALVRAGQLDEFKFEVQQYVSEEVADKMRWDTDNTEHTEMRDIALRITDKLDGTSGAREWLGNGLRLLSDMKYYVSTMRQMAFANPDVAGLQHIDMSMTDFKALKSKLEFRAVENVARWSKMGKEQAGLLERAMREEQAGGVHLAELTEVNGVQRFVPSEALHDYAAKHKLDEASVKLWLDLKNSYLQHINVLHKVLRNKLVARTKGKPMTLRKKAGELAQIFEVIRQQPFLPQTRFGQYAVHVKEPGTDGAKIVHVEFFESRSTRDEAKKLLEAHLRGSGRTVHPAKYTNTAAILRTLPPEILSTYAEEFELTEGQRKELREITDAITRNPQLRKYSSQLAAVTGANKNLLRNYADFMSHDSNNIAKLHYREEFMKGLRQIAELQRTASNEQDYVRHDELVRLGRFAHSYVQHIMNPAEEFHTLRSYVVLKQLWGNIKTALANVNSLAQLWALASTQQGLVRGTLNVNKDVLKTLGDSIHNVSRRILRQPVEGSQVFSPDERWALNQAKVNGLLDETFAAQLASFANASTLNRLNLTRTDNLVKQVLWVGMLPQHAVENFTRRVTLLTQFKGYLAAGDTKEKAYDKAQRDLYLLQGDNTQSNRPAFMRGKWSLVTIYYGYMQNMMYLMLGAQERARNYQAAIERGVPSGLTDEQVRKRYARIRLGGETVKMWLAYAAMGGLMGLPGAEDLDKILGLVAKKLFGADFSLKEHAYALARTITEQASEFGIDINPRSLVHGNMSDLNLFGLLPSVDVSPSMSLGQALPGLGGVDKLGARGGLGDFLAGAMGPFGTIFKDLQDTFGDDPSMLKKMSLVLPNTAKNVAKAYDNYYNGVTYPSGGKVTFDRATGTVRDLTTGESLSQLLGFQPTIVTSNRELHWMQKDKQDYWTQRRNGLTLQMWEAVRHGDREAVADVTQAVREFNESADPVLRLSMSDVSRSMKKRQAAAKTDEQRAARSARYRGMYADLEKDFTGK